MQIYALSSIHDIFWLQVQTSIRGNICLHTSEGQREGKFGQELPCPQEKKAISQLLCFLGTAEQKQGLGFSVSLCSCFIAYLGCQKFPGGRGWLPCQRTDPSGLHFLGEASTRISLGRLTVLSACRTTTNVAACTKDWINGSVLQLIFSAKHGTQWEMKEYYHYSFCGVISFYV